MIRRPSEICASTRPDLCGPDGITAQHIRDLFAVSTDDILQQVLVDFTNLMLSRAFDEEVNSIIFGGRLITLSKKDGGIRPISVGYTLKRLAAKGHDRLETFLSKVAFESTFWKVYFRKWAMSHWKVRIESFQ